MKLIALTAALALAGTAAAQTAPAGQDMAQPATQNVEDPKGGYEPTSPLFSAPPAPGAKIVFVPSTQTPDEAYPAPAPLAKYPICKRGQFDNCMQRGGR